MKLYDILFFFYSESGQVDLSFNTLLKKTRSTMMGNYLASEESVKKVLESCCTTLQFCLDHKLDGKFFEVKMLCRSVVTRCQKNYASLEEFTRLKTLIDTNEKCPVSSTNNPIHP